MKRSRTGPASDNANKLYSLTQCAAYCRRSVGVFRKHYANRMLPEPQLILRGSDGRKLRYFTLAECKQIKNIFDSMEHGKMSPRKRIKRHGNYRYS